MKYGIQSAVMAHHNVIMDRGDQSNVSLRNGANGLSNDER